MTDDASVITKDTPNKDNSQYQHYCSFVVYFIIFVNYVGNLVKLIPFLVSHILCLALSGVVQLSLNSGNNYIMIHIHLGFLSHA